jgi:hypothetical protein
MSRYPQFSKLSQTPRIDPATARRHADWIAAVYRVQGLLRQFDLESLVPTLSLLEREAAHEFADELEAFTNQLRAELAQSQKPRLLPAPIGGAA